MAYDNIARNRAQIFALANKLWADDPASKNEHLHDVVAGITGKQSIKELSLNDFVKVANELTVRLDTQGISARPTPKKPSKPQVQGKISAAQSSKLWRLMYLIIDCDEVPDKSTAGTRLCGIIKKECHITASVKNPTAWLSAYAAKKLIDIMKGYLETEEARKAAMETQKRGDEIGKLEC